MKKPSITVPQTGDQGVRNALDALKENMEIVTGRRGGQVAMLPPNPTTAQIAAKINELLTRLQ